MFKKTALFLRLGFPYEEAKNYYEDAYLSFSDVKASQNQGSGTEKFPGQGFLKSLFEVHITAAFLSFIRIG